MSISRRGRQECLIDDEEARLIASQMATRELAAGADDKK